MVSVGLVGKAVTRQLEKDQDKGKLVRGRCQYVSGGDEVGRRQDKGQTDRGQREIRARGDKRDSIEKAGTESSKQKETERGRDMWIKMGITYCERYRQAGPLRDGWLVTQILLLPLGAQT